MQHFRSFNLAVQFYHLSLTLRLSGALRDQLDRAASSIALNLAEGRGKATVRDQVKFFQIAMGSLRECQGILILAKLQDTEAWKLLDMLGAHLYRLLKNAG